MNQLFTLLFAAIAAVCVFYPTNVVGSAKSKSAAQKAADAAKAAEAAKPAPSNGAAQGGKQNGVRKAFSKVVNFLSGTKSASAPQRGVKLSSRQKSINAIFSQYIEGRSYSDLRDKGITRVQVVREVAPEVEHVFASLSKKLQVIPIDLPSEDIDIKEVRERIPKGLEGATLLIDSNPRRLQTLSQDYAVLSASNPWAPQTWKSLSLTQRSPYLDIQEVQANVDGMMAANFKFNKDTSERLNYFKVINLIIVNEVTFDLYRFQVEAALADIKVYPLQLVGSPTNIKAGLQNLLKAKELKETLLVDWNPERIANVVDIVTVAQNLPKFCMQCMRSYLPLPAEPFDLYQDVLNVQINKKLGGTSELVNLVQKGGVLAVAIDFYGIVVPSDTRLYIGENDNYLSYKVTEAFKEFVKELQRMGIALFIIDNTTDEKSLIGSSGKVITGRELIFTALKRQGIFPADVFPHSLTLQLTSELSRRSTFNVRSVQDATRLLPHQILVIDDDLCDLYHVSNLKMPQDMFMANKLRHPVLYMDNKGPGSKGGWDPLNLKPVPFYEAQAACRAASVSPHQH